MEEMNETKKFALEAQITLSRISHDWQNPSTNRSVMMPPFFLARYQEAFVKRGEETAARPSGSAVASRNIQGQLKGDEAEHLVFDDIKKLTDKVPLKMLTLHQLNIDAKLKLLLKGVIALQAETELDFLCISPLLGCVAIEVKAMDERTSASACRTGLKKARENLKRARAFIKEVSAFVGIHFVDNIVHQLVVLPCIEKDVLTQKIGLHEEMFCENIRSPIIFQRQTEKSVIHNYFLQLKSDMGQYYDETWRFYIEMAPVLSQIQKLSRETYGLQEHSLANYTAACSLQIQQHRLVENISKKVNTEIVRTKSRRIREGVDGDSTVVFRNLIGVHFLTPEQLQVWKGSEHQCIVGYAGTGKTVLLTAKLSQMAQLGRKVLMFSRYPYSRMYDALFRAHGWYCCRSFNLRSMPFQFPDVFDYIKSTYGPNTVVTSEEKMRQAALEELGKARDQAVFLDDAFAAGQLRADLQEPVMLRAVKFLLDNEAFSALWVAYDHRFLCEETQLSEVYHSSRLTTVLRNARNVFSNSHSSARYPLQLKPALLGHNIAGATPFKVVLTYRTRGTEAKATLSNFLVHQLHELGLVGTKDRSESLSLSDVAVLTTNQGTSLCLFSEYSLTSALRPGLAAKGIAVSDVKGQGAAKATGTNLAALDVFHNTFSFEWPVVFAVSAFGSMDESSDRSDLSTFGSLGSMLHFQDV